MSHYTGHAVPRHDTNTPLSIEEVVARFNGRPSGKGYQAKCPCHEDRHPSLSIFIGDDGFTKVMCHAKCDWRDVLAAVGLKPADLKPPKYSSRSESRWKKEEQVVYRYQTADGATSYEVVRYRLSDGGKTFKQRRLDGKGGFIWNMKGVEPLPYHLPELLSAIKEGRTIYIVEGEKDVDNLRRLGFAATCNHGGAKKWYPSLNQWFNGADVVILPDNDDAGRKHAELVISSLQGIAKRIRLLELPDLPPKGDVSDWIASGGTAEELVRLTSAAQLWVKMDHPPVDVHKRPVALEVKDVLLWLDRNERGDAEMLSHIYDGRLAYDTAGATWYVWNGHRWTADDTGMINNLIEHIADQYDAVAATGVADENAKRLRKRAWELRHRTRIKQVLEIAAHLPGVPVSSDQWDADPNLLGVRNGVLDLTTSDFRAGKPSDFIRTICPVDWQGSDTPAPRWEQFINELFPEEGMPAFIQRLLGYSITGYTREHILVILWGSQGRNGKDTLMAALRHVLGNYACPVDSTVLIDTGRGRSAGAAQPHIAALQGKRVVWVSEPGYGERINAAQAKLITGGGELSARRLHENERTFVPTHTVFLLTNPKPHIPPYDEALWNRILLIPFTKRFVDNPTASNEYQRDPELVDKLRSEAPGILAWLVKGSLEWQAVGLNPPDYIKGSVGEYRHEEDTIAQFLDERCDLFADGRALAGVLYAAYSAWASAKGVTAENQKNFGIRMKGKFHHTEPKGRTQYHGLRLSDME